MESSGISGYDATISEDRDAILRLVHHYEGLRQEVHLPYLDSLVLEKYVVKPVLEFAEAAGNTRNEEEEGQRLYLNLQEAKLSRDQALNRLVVLVTSLTDHKQRTLEVLEGVVRRDAAWKGLMSALESVGGDSDDTAEDQQNANKTARDTSGTVHVAGAPSRRVVSVETAALIQHHMYVLQRATLHVVEKIAVWREGLSLPHPFVVGSENYILRIISDTAHLATNKAIESIIPMQSLFFRYPLCSNLPSLARFAEDPAKPSFSAHRSATGYGPVTDGTVTKRLQAAEAMIHAEVETQLTVVRQLLDLCSRNRFLPVLQLKKLYPQVYSTGSRAAGSVKRGGSGSAGSSSIHGSTASHVGPGTSALRGIPLHNAALQQKLEAALLGAFETLRNPPFRSAYEAVMGVSTGAAQH